MEKAKLYKDFLYIGAIMAPFTDVFAVECQFNPTELIITHGVNWGGQPVAERDFPARNLRAVKHPLIN